MYKKNETYEWLSSRVKWQHLIAGVSGGVVATLIVHPLDLVKIRFQVDEGPKGSIDRPKYTGMIDALSSIRQHHGWRGLYQGVTPNLWGAGSAWGIYFLCYNAVKTHLQGVNADTPLGPGVHMMAAAGSGLFTLALTNPIWVAKTRLCLQYDTVSSGQHRPVTKPDIVPQTTQQYKGMVHCLLTMYTTEGIRSWYKGFLPGMFGVSHGALQFMAYEELKKLSRKYRYQKLDRNKFNVLEYLCFAALSKIFAATITYPYQVVRARLQDQHHQYKGVTDVIQQTVKREGVRGFYKGLVPGVVRVIPACCITFVVYEQISFILLSNPKSSFV